MRRPTRSQIGYALLFSLPPGVGTVGFVATRIGTPPEAVALGAAVTLGLFAFVLVAATAGEADHDRRY